MKAIIANFMIVGLMLSSSFSFGQQTGLLPMPPVFSTKIEREIVLKDYPLGVITKQAAFSHHGKPVHVATLPNGLEGWTYEVGEGFGLHTYTLEFDKRGVVIDVLYNENGRHDGLTALQVQRQQKKTRK
ncbi:hypothetical protein [Sulfurirhabdus autotrophica]|uniref:PepSY domain-containing protein n=1 Tax=Sulfurirhabdus autotrophica TaxID=1706046 RepID=A0A4V2W315_9PROT|nr:hypothetical protein [Sulfurirhabdus autotrophica]TCV90249.1 hypothetical protein EDC63_101219 [Sulfurirhabdus autotrophica]